MGSPAQVRALSVTLYIFASGEVLVLSIGIAVPRNLYRIPENGLFISKSEYIRETHNLIDFTHFVAK